MNRSTLFDKLRDRGYRDQFVAAQVRRTIAMQIKSLREEVGRRWTQAELGERAGMKQAAIARLENPAYGDFTVKTLLRIARAFDIGLIVRFAPFGEIVNWNQTVSVASYVPVSFDMESKTNTPTITEYLVKPPLAAYFSPELITPAQDAYVN
jgi:transcriptional regulator with XRE-family HTH domain